MILSNNTRHAMMDSSKIEKNYTQSGDVCVFASYSIIMHYFSSGKLHVNDLIDSYLPACDLTRTSGDRKVVEKEVFDHYMETPPTLGLRGFEFIALQHTANKFLTANYCKVRTIDWRKDDEPCSKCFTESLATDLKNGGLAMVLRPAGSSRENGFHSIVVGFDSIQKFYFCRDPNSKEIIKNYDLMDIDICEYILFEKM